MLPVFMLIQDEILHEYWLRKKFYDGISWNLLVMVLGCPCRQEINFSKIRVT